MNQRKTEFPVLETGRLILRELCQADAGALYPIWSDPRVTEYFVLEPFETLQQTQDMISLLTYLPEAEQGFRWAIALRATGTVVGTCGFHNRREEHCRTEIGYELSSNYWGQKIMTEALTAILTFGFCRLDFNRVEAFVNFGNVKSTGLLEKLGFTRDGLLREYEFARGVFVDQYCYSLLKSEFNRERMKGSAGGAGPPA